MKYTLTIEADSASEMEDIAKAFSGLGGSAAPTTKPVKKPAKQEEPEVDDEEEESDQEETGEKISVEEFRMKMQAYFKDDKKKTAEVKALIAKAPYNAKNLSGVDGSHYAAILKKLKIA